MIFTTYFWFFGNFTSCTRVPFISQSFHVCPSPYILLPIEEKQIHVTPPLFPPLYHIILYCGGIGSCDVSHSVPFCSSSFSCTCSLQWDIGLVQGLWLLLVHHQYWTLTDTPLGCPVIALSHRGPTALVLQDQFLPMQLVDGVYVCGGGGGTQSPGCGPGW